MPSFLSRIRARGGLTIPVLTSDSTPAANELALYAKSDGRVYKKTSGGAESVMDGTRWGVTTIWVNGTATNAPVSFPDGLPPRVGDWVVSNNGIAPGAVSKVTAVVNSTTANLDSTDGVDLRGPAGANATALNAYPVGAIYMSVVNTSPATLFGGTWATWGTGRVPVAVDTGQTEFNTVEKTGGAKTHTLTTTEMPQHRHQWGGIVGVDQTAAGGTDITAAAGASFGFSYLNTGQEPLAGGNGAHNNLQPYITCYMWKRTA